MELFLHRFLPLTESEGPGKRACLWVQGCSIQCDGCGVPWTWKKNSGRKIEVARLFNQILTSKEENEIEGVTFLGGEPFDQAQALSELGSMIKKANLSLMTFSGYEYEYLISEEKKEWNSLLQVTDLLIDGPFKKEKLNLSRPWVGSSNQQYRFLTDYYKYLEPNLTEVKNKLEVRLTIDGRIAVNGMATQSTLSDLFEKKDFNQIIRD